MSDLNIAEIRSALEFAKKQRNAVVQELVEHLDSCLSEIETLQKLAKETAEITVLNVGDGELLAITPPLGTTPDRLDSTLDTIRRFVGSHNIQNTLVVGLFNNAKVEHLDRAAMSRLGWERSE